MRYCEYKISNNYIQFSPLACILLASHTCGKCGMHLCGEHSVYIEETGVYLCPEHFQKFQEESMPHPVGPEPLSPPTPRKHQSAVGPTKRVHVRFTDKFYDGPVYVREVVQEKVLTERAVYVLEGGAILETPHGDVYLTKEQYEYMFEEV